uniref:TIP41-like protein n=1 Tax=Noccaea caerulescens TaxID=107243 RepID=A0A1J3CZZ9_NOCCA
MEPTSVIDDAEFWLPPEFLTDDDFLVEKENNGGGIDESNKKRHGFDSRSGSTCKPIGDEDHFLAGLTKQMVQSTLEDDFYTGFSGNDNKAWGTTRLPLCAAGIECGCQNQISIQHCRSRVSSQATWDLYCAAAEEMAKMNIKDESYGYNNQIDGGLLNLPRKHPLAAAKIPNNGSGYHNHQSLSYQKLQAIQFQQLKHQQMMKHHRQLLQSRCKITSNKNGGGPVGLSPSAWSNQLPRRDGSGMRAVFLGDHAGKRGSTGTGVFLPRSVNHTSSATAETLKKSTPAAVLVPARVAEFLNLDDSVVHPVVRSSTALNDVLWRQRSNNGGLSRQIHGGVRSEQAVNELQLPSEWAY